MPVTSQICRACIALCLFALANLDAKTIAPKKARAAAVEPAAAPQVEVADNRKYAISLWGALGLNSPGPLFGAYPGSTGPSYRLAWDFMADGAYFFKPRHAAVFGLGSGVRELGFKDDAGNGYWKSLFLDTKAGYRYLFKFLFVEGGLLFSVRLKDAPLYIETAGATTTGTMLTVEQYSYLSLYGQAGAIYSFSPRFFVVAAARVIWGVTPAIKGTWPTGINTSGTILTSDAISLVPINMSINLGVGFRF